MGRIPKTGTLAAIDAQIAQLEAELAAGARTPGLRGRLRLLRKRRTWYAHPTRGDRHNAVLRSLATLGVRHRPSPPAVPDDLIVDTRSL